MLCPKCGTANPDTSEMCFNCGQILTGGRGAPWDQSSVTQSGGEPVPDWLMDLQKGLPEELRDPELEKMLRQKTFAAAPPVQPPAQPRVQPPAQPPVQPPAQPPVQPPVHDKREKPIVVDELPTEVHTESDEWLHSVLDSMRNDFIAPAAPEETFSSAQEADWLDAFISPSVATGPTASDGVQPGVSPVESAFQDNWLSGLRDTTKDIWAEEEKEDSPAGAPQDVPDWLQNIPFAAPPGVPPVAPVTQGPFQADPTIPPDEESDLPAWLAEMEVASTNQPPSKGDDAIPAISETQETTEVPDWLQGFLEPSADVAAEPALSSTEVPSWLRGHQIGQDSVSPSIPSVRGEGGSDEPVPEQPVPTAEQSTPDWLSTYAVEPSILSKQEQEPVSIEGVQSLTRPDELTKPMSPIVKTDISGAIGPDATVPMESLPKGATDADMPEWLLGLRAQDAALPPEEAAPGEDESYQETEIPDWLRADKGVFEQRLDERALEDETLVTPTLRESKDAPKPAEASERLNAEIFRSAQNDRPETDEIDETVIALPTEIFGPLSERSSLNKEENVPEWLRDSLQESYDEVPDSLIETDRGLPGRDIGATATMPRAQMKPGEAPAETPDMPGWLRQLRAQDTFEETPLPSWLTEPEVELESSLPKEEIPQMQEETPGWLAGLAPPEETKKVDESPVWLRDLNSMPEEISKEISEMSEMDEGDVPAWLKQMGGSTAFDEKPKQTDGAATQAFPEMKDSQKPSPDQPTMKAPVPAKPAQDKSESPTEAIVAAATQRMRAEPITESPETFQLKGGAILAGIGSALTPPAGLSFLKPEPQIISEALTESTEQSSVFQEIVNQPLIPREPSLGRKHRGLWAMVGRVILYLLIIAVVGITLYWQGAEDVGFFHEYNIPISPRVQAVYDQINSVPERSTVLLIADYEPSLAEELNTQARTLLQSLIQRNLKILIVSTTFTGPQVMQNIIEDLIQRQASSYKYGEDYANLGYLPGQETSLLLFGQSPLSAVRVDFRDRVDLRNYPITSALEKVPQEGLGQAIPLIIHLSGSEETLRVWIEQVLARQTDARMIAGVSAGLEPYAYSFLESGQLAGLLSGLTGAAEYEALTKNPGRAVRSIDSQVGIHLVVAGVILLGNIVYILGRILRRR